MDRTETTDLARLRAAYAYEQVSGWAGTSWFDSAAKLVKGLPVSLRTLGLPVTLATLIRDGKTWHRELAGLLSRWLLEKAPHRPLSPWHDENQETQSGKHLLSACIRADRSAYLAAQAEALALLEFVKLFADVFTQMPDETSRKEEAGGRGDDNSEQP